MASTYLTRTPASAGTQTKATISVWLKRANLTSNQCYFSTGNNNVVFKFVSNDKLTVYDFNGSSMDLELTTTQLFRDPSAWYHIVVSLDSTQATASDRAKLYVNGSLISNFDSTTYPSQNYNFKVNGTLEHFIGRLSGLSQYFDGSLAHFHNIDGTAYDADTFGETDSTTGIWKPKTAPSVTYGTNGFFLKFENSGAFGTDSSGNSNTFTVNGTMTQTIDTPSNVFATLNPLVKTASQPTFSKGNLKIDVTGNWNSGAFSSIGLSSGKWYWEAKAVSGNNTNVQIGVATENINFNASVLYNETGTLLYETAQGRYLDGNYTASVFGLSYGNGDIIGVALDLDSGTKTVTFTKNGTTMSGGTQNLSSNFNNSYIFPMFIGSNSGASAGWEINFGNGIFGTTAVSSAQNPDDGIGIFEYSVPTGYRALCTKSINAEEYS